MLRAHQKYIFSALSSLPIQMAAAFVSRLGCGLILIHKMCNSLYYRIIHALFIGVTGR